MSKNQIKAAEKVSKFLKKEQIKNSPERVAMQAAAELVENRGRTVC